METFGRSWVGRSRVGRVAKLMLLDGNSLTYRAFFALPTDMATASGQVTNAAFGFTSMLINMIRDHEPDGIMVAFDRPEPTFRHEMIPTYKAQREAAPDILRQQMGLVREIVDALHIPMAELVGFEADDVLATLATRARDNGDDVMVVTGDRDTYQLVEDPHVRVLYNKRGVSDYALYDEAGILDRTGVTPKLYPQYAALRGDNSDNLPGVPGVGEKTASRLINKYGGLDGIFANVDEQTPKLRENLIEHEARARLNLDAMVLVRDAPVDLDIAGLRWDDVDADEVSRLFEFLEFRSLYDRLNDVLKGRLPTLEATGGVLEAELTTATSPPEAVQLLEMLRSRREPVAIAPSWVDERLDGLAFVTTAEDGEVAYIGHELFADNDVARALSSLFDDGGVPINTHHAKPVIRALSRFGVDLTRLDIDTELAAYLVDPADNRYGLDALLLRYLQLELATDSAAAAGQLDFEGDAVAPAQVAAREALGVDALAPAMAEMMQARDRKSTRLNSSHTDISRMPSSA